MIRVNKCCFVFDLKYGFITYATILLLFRITAIMMLWNKTYLEEHINSNLNMQTDFTMPLIGYLSATVVAVLIALRGIINERSILIYPYLVVSIIELIITLAPHAWAVIVISVWHLLPLTFVGFIEFYIFICLLSLYDEIKERERMGSPKDYYEGGIVLKV